MKALDRNYVKPMVIVHVICLLSIIVFKFFNIIEINNFYFAGFIFMSFLMLKALRSDRDDDEKFSWSALFVWDLCYIAVMFFKFGRFFVRGL